MKKFLFSNSYPSWAFDIATFIFRVGVGILMIPHGYGKLTGFATMKNQFVSLFGISSTVCLSLTIFAEFFCSILLILGLFTRFAALALFITFCVVVFKAHPNDYFGKGEMGSVYLLGYTLLLLVGPGKYSMDRLIGK